jgi:hypothetical protein
MKESEQARLTYQLKIIDKGTIQGSKKIKQARGTYFLEKKEREIS